MPSTNSYDDQMMRAYEAQHQGREDVRKAKTYLNRWLRVIREELGRMHVEGEDPYIAWLSVRIATDAWETDHIGELRPVGREKPSPASANSGQSEQ